MGADAASLCGTCPKQLRCQRGKLACQALLMFKGGASLERIRLVPRQPTAAWAAQVTAAKTAPEKAPTSWRNRVNQLQRAAAGDDDYL